MMPAAIHPQRLFWAGRVAIAVSAARFIAITAIMDPLKDAFGLNNVQVGWIGGAGLWGFPVTMLIFGSLCNVFGMKLILWLAVLAYLSGASVMLAASGFPMLFVGSLLMAMGDGLVQSAANPMTTTLFADRKTEMINKLHLAFAVGVALFGLVAYGLGDGLWQAKLALVIVPTAVFGAMFFGQKFPATERVQMGVSFGQMLRETFLRPLFLLLALCMMMTASVELASNTWLTPVLVSAGIPGILVLVWVYLLTAVLRQASGPVVRRISSSGILLCSAIVSGLGLIWLSYAHSLLTALAAGTVFAAGVAYFWPTMIGTTSERVPKGGAVALAMMGSVGAGAVGLIAIPLMGWVADRYVYQHLPAKDTVACLKQIVAEYSHPEFVGRFKGPRQDEVRNAAKAADAILRRCALTDDPYGQLLREGAAAASPWHPLKFYSFVRNLPFNVAAATLLAAGHSSPGGAKLPEPRTTAALRAAIQAAPKSAAAAAAHKLLRPVESAGGQLAFRWAALMSAALTLIFGGLYLRERMTRARVEHRNRAKASE